MTQDVLKDLEDAIAHQRWDKIDGLIHTALKITPSYLQANVLLKMGRNLRACSPAQTHHAIKVYELAKGRTQLPRQLALVNAQLSELYAQIDDFTKASEYGNTTLAINQQMALAYRPTKKLVAFSLFGAKPEYCEMGILNAELMPKIYPGWHMAVYHNDSVPPHVLTRLAALGVELIDIKTLKAEHMPGTFWRFLALERDDCDVVIMRDIDSLISKREQVLVDEWLASDKPFHLIRDWYGQTDLILAGLWGARMGFMANIRHWIDTFLQRSTVIHPTHADQYFLAQYIWPRIKDFALHHSSVFDYDYGNGKATWPNMLPRDTKQGQSDRLQLGAWQTTFLDVKLQQPFEVLFLEGEREICRYAYQAGERCEIPRQYRHYLTSGKWQLAVMVNGQTKPVMMQLEQVMPVARTSFVLNRQKRQQ